MTNTKELVSSIISGQDYSQEFNKVWSSIVANKLESIKNDVVSNIMEISTAVKMSYAKQAARQIGAAKNIEHDPILGKEASKIKNKRMKGVKLATKGAEHIDIKESELTPEQETENKET